MDKQQKIFERLVFGSFPSNLVSVLYSSRKGSDDAFYINANYKVQEPNYTRPEDRRKYFEHDVIMALIHCGERSGRKKIMDKDILSIEIKTSADDIIKSSVDQYLGATRLFFIAACKDLLPVLIERYSGHPRRQVIGMIDSDSGDIVVLPQFQDFQKDRRDRLLARCYTSEHRFPYCNDVEPYSIHRIRDSSFEKPEWIAHNGLRINPDYRELFGIK